MEEARKEEAKVEQYGGETALCVSRTCGGEAAQTPSGRRRGKGNCDMGVRMEGKPCGVEVVRRTN